MQTGSLTPSIPQSTVPASTPKHDALKLAVIALAYFFAHQVAFLFPDAGKVLAAVWPAGGIGLAALLLSPRRLWPAIATTLFVAGNTANLLDGRPLVNSLGYMTANVLESLACALFILRWCGEHVTFTRVKDILALLCAATLVNAATALLGAGTAALTTAAPFWSFWGTWWVADGLGILLVAPLIVTFRGFERANLIRHKRQAFEGGLFIVIWVAAAWLAFQPPDARHVFTLQPYMLIALLAWPALRLGQRGVTFTLILLTLRVVTSPVVTVGPLLWGGSNPAERLLLAQIYLACVGLAGLLLAASYAETTTAERTSRENQARLRALSDNLPNGAVYQVLREADGQQRFVYLSAGIEPLTGVSAKTALQDPQALYALFVEEDRPAIIAAEAASARDLSLFSAVVRQRRLDGQERWMQLTSVPRRLADGRTVWDGIQLDVTERKLAEQLVQQQNDLLQAQNEELTAQREELQSQNEGLRAQQEKLQQTEAELRTSQANLNKAQRVAKVGSWAWHIQANQLEWSDEMFSIFGLARTNFTGDLAEVMARAIHPDDRPEVERANLSVMRDKKPVPLEYRVVWPDGTVRVVWAEAGEFTLDDAGCPLTLTGIVQDITGRKQAEAALLLSEEKFAKAFRTSPEAMSIASLEDGTHLDVNDEFLSATGFERADVIGRTSKDLNVWVKADDRQRYVEQLATTGQLRQFETQYRLKSGAIRDFLVSGTEIKISSKPYSLNFILDITDRKQGEILIQAQQEQLVAQNEELAAQNEELATQSRALEATETELRQLNRDLEQRIQARSAELRIANAELTLANAALLRAGRMKDEFLANMSHELRTPLTGILGLAEVMDKGIYGDLSKKQRQALTLIQASGEHLLQLINDILDLSKVEAGKVELQMAPVLVEELCQVSLGFVTQTAHNKRLRLSLQHDTQVRLMQADERRLKQMLVNLLSNAVKFTPEDGQVGLEVAGDPTHQQVRFTIWDTGIGIAPEKHALLFQPFVQLDGSLARKYEGTGLGLALVHSLAELHGGSVTVESAGLGQGSRFTITLPWAPPDAVKSAESASSGLASAEPVEVSSRLVSLAALLGRPPVILAADDNPTMLMVLTSYLEALECRVVIAQNGAEALSLAQTTLPDLILLDIHMPDLDGLTVVRRLRAAGSTVSVIALTALAMPGDRERCLAAGADDYLSKPMSLGELTSTVARWLAKKHAGETLP